MKIYLLFGLFSLLPLLLSAQNRIDLLVPDGTKTEAPYALATDLATLPATFIADIPLGEDRTVSVDFEKRASVHVVSGVQVYYGNSGDPLWAHLEHYHDVVLVVNENIGGVLVNLFRADGAYTVEAVGENLYRSRKEPDHVCTIGGADDGLVGTPTFATAAEIKSVMANCGERDAAGNYVADVFVGFSHQSAAITPDVQSYAVAQVETVNLCLSNTLVEDIYLRLVEIGINSAQTGVLGSGRTTLALDFAEEIQRSGADFGAFFQAPYQGVSGGGGLATIEGRFSTNGVNSSVVFRHEWGHNSGSHHCYPDGTEDNPYAHGHSNGNMASALCGNDLFFYSNPDLTAGTGAPIGVENRADNHRNMTERRAIYADYARHTIPFEATDTDNAPCPGPLAEDVRYHIRNRANGKFLTRGSGDIAVLTDAPDVNAEWNLHQFDSEAFYLANLNQGEVLGVSAGQDYTGTQLELRSVTEDIRKVFTLEATDPGFYRIGTLANGLQWVQSPAGVVADGTPVERQPGNTTQVSEWRFEPIAGSTAADFSTTSMPASCINGTDGTMTVNVTNPQGTLTYSWPDGQTGATASGLTPGTYVVTVTDNGMSYRVRGGIMSQTLPLIPDIDITPALPGGNGSAEVVAVDNATGSLSYAWSDGGSGASRTDLPPALYTVTITDNTTGCDRVQEVLVGTNLEDGTEYLIQHVASGLYVFPREGGATSGNVMVLGNCPTDEDFYRWRAVRKDNLAFELLNVRANRYMTNSGQIGTGQTIRLTSTRTSNNDFFLESVSADTYFMTFYNGSRIDISGDDLVQTNAASGTQAEFRFVPIVDCPAGAEAACDDGNPATNDDILNLACSCCGLVLPVTWQSFVGEVLPKVNRLSWATAAEEGNAGFGVERSVDGLRFREIGFVPANAVRDYIYIDETPPSGRSFYRLRQQDLDGATSLSPIVVLDRDETGWRIVPNPVTSGNILSVLAAEPESMELELLGMTGQSLRVFARGQQLLPLVNLPTGVYLLRNRPDGTVRRVVVR